MQDNKTVTKKNSTVSVGYNNNSLLMDLLIMVTLCFAGVFCKKLINPAANAITDSLHVPGGISTAVALMFMVIAAGITKRCWSASAMGVMQAAFALAMGTMGSMGFLMPLAYLIPGVVIDLVMLIPLSRIFTISVKAFIANVVSSVSAALFADLVVFHLPVKPLSLYICLAALSGAVCGFVAGAVTEPIAGKLKGKNDNNEDRVGDIEDEER